MKIDKVGGERRERTGDFADDYCFLQIATALGTAACNTLRTESVAVSILCSCDLLPNGPATTTKDHGDAPQ